MSKKNLVILSGAGISAESGLKTFRDSDGLWEGFDVMEVATPRGWRKDPALVLDFYNQRRKDVAKANPNEAHKQIASLEEHFNVSIITQNIDDLHERGGSTKILHLHGEIFKMRSSQNEDLVSRIEGDINVGDVAADGAQLRPDIVWFEEPVPRMELAVPIAMAADIFVVVGTSLVVYPAASLINYVSLNAPKFIVDKNIPFIPEMRNLIKIEKPATLGIAELKEIGRAHV